MTPLRECSGLWKRSIVVFAVWVTIGQGLKTITYDRKRNHYYHLKEESRYHPCVRLKGVITCRFCRSERKSEPIHVRKTPCEETSLEVRAAILEEPPSLICLIIVWKGGATLESESSKRGARAARKGAVFVWKNHEAVSCPKGEEMCHCLKEMLYICIEERGYWLKLLCVEAIEILFLLAVNCSYVQEEPLGRERHGQRHCEDKLMLRSNCHCCEDM